MALIACYECGAQISSGARKCPHCGAANKNVTAVQRVWVLLILGVLAVAVVASLLS